MLVIFYEIFRESTTKSNLAECERHIFIMCLWCENIGDSECRAMMIKVMVFRNTWVYSKEDTTAHTRRLVVTS